MSLRQFDLGGFVEPNELLLLEPAAQLPADNFHIEMPQKSPSEPELDFGAPYLEFVPIYQPRIDLAQDNRNLANFKSDWRAEKAPAVGALVFASEGSRWSRLGAVAVVGKVWYSDHEDGVYARRSDAIAKEIIAEYPEAAKNLQIIHLLSQAVKTDGGERDQKADKALTNEINKGLLARAIRAGDFAAMTILSGTIELTAVRNNLMTDVRAEGVKNEVRVGAKGLGKLKTVMLAVGQTIMVGSKSESAINRVGLGIIAASNAPSWGAVWQMKRSIKNQIAAKRQAGNQPSPESIEKYKQLLDGQYFIDLEGEPVEALRAA